MKICVVGSGYVGLSLAVLTSQKYEVSLLDINEQTINLVNSRVSPIKDVDLENFLADKKLNLKATTNKHEAYSNANFIVIATPTDYDAASGSFNTSSVEQVITDILEFNCRSTIVIKSTIPFGYTDTLRNKFNKKNIFFSPEFLRETKALYDNLHPSRIIVGDTSTEAKKFGEILLECSQKNETDTCVLHMESKEAEAIKLFANTFLAMRIAFFNELDSFCETQKISTKNVIKGACLDSRIGNYYNNPSFGYGGYCLPKDTKQLLENFGGIPNSLIKATVDSNEKRKNFIVNSITNKTFNTIGIYRLIMKDGSDNYRESAVLDILEKIKGNENKIILYEPIILENEFNGVKVVNNIEEFIKCSDLIIANRISHDLDHVMDKVYSRDLFNEN